MRRNAEQIIDGLLEASNLDIRGPMITLTEEQKEMIANLPRFQGQQVVVDPPIPDSIEMPVGYKPLDPNKLTPFQCIFILDCYPLRFNSHRSRDRALGHRQLLTEREVIATGKWKFRACYSWTRASKGGYYIVEPTLASEILARKIKGVTTLRRPYDDLRWCW